MDVEDIETPPTDGEWRMPMPCPECDGTGVIELAPVPTTFVAASYGWGISDRDGTWTDENPGPYTVTRNEDGSVNILRTQEA